MKTYKFVCRSTRRGFTEWASVMEDGVEVRRIDPRDVWQETVRQFREPGWAHSWRPRAISWPSISIHSDFYGRRCIE